MRICKKYISMEKQENSFLVHADEADIKIYFLTNEIVRIRASFHRKMEEESYILSATAWEDRMDAFIGKERTRIKAVMPEVKEETNAITLSTSKTKLIIQKDPLCFKLFNEKGELLYSDLEGMPFVLDSNGRVIHYNEIEETDCFYGFGENSGEINKVNDYIRLSPKDAMGFDPVKTNPLYKHIPFYIKLNRHTKAAIGIFYHNTYECAFSMGSEKSNYWPRYSYYQADGGDIDLFLIAGDRMNEILDNYTLLTGRPVMLPKRALGYQGSSMYYSELEKDCDEAIENFVRTVKEEGFPIDGFYLSSGYTESDNKRYVFTWNHERFNNPEEYFKNMNEMGAQNIVNVKPGVLLTHPYFKEMETKEVFIKNSEGNATETGKWWGGEGVFWDFTNPKARGVWKEYLLKNVIALGTDSVWNDNCEYDGLMDKDAVCCFDGKTETIGRLKPVMGNLMSKISREAILEHNPNARPYIVCRSGFAGIQKYAQTWCGDNYTSWDSLKYNIATILGMGLSGVPYEGADIGGFSGKVPEKELFVRWIQNGIFQPRFAVHSVNEDNTVTELWMYEDVKDIIRDAVLLRYRLEPYLYSAMYHAHKTGEPIMRPLVYEFQEDHECYEENFEFLFGRDILIANVLEEGATSKKIYLPKGANWYDFNTYKQYAGGQTIEIPVSLNSIPMFLRSGTILPMSQMQIMSMEKNHVTDMKLIIVPQDGISYELYEDDGVTNNYENGIYRKTYIEVKLINKNINIQFSSEGEYEDLVDTIELEIVSRDKSPLVIKNGSNELKRYTNYSQYQKANEGWYYNITKRAVMIKYKNPKQDYVLDISYEAFDMIKM